MKALSKERHDRYPNVTAFIAALQSPSVQQIPPPPPPPYPLRQAGGSPVHTPPIRDARQTPPLQNRGQNNAYPPGMAAQVATKPTGGDRALAAFCYLSPLFTLICYFVGRKRPFMRFHFMQSLIFFFFVLLAIIFISSGSDAVNPTLGAIRVIYILLTLLYMILAGAGKRAHIPIIGWIASRYANRQPKGARKIS